MNEIQKIIYDQFLEYCENLQEVEKEIIRKYKAGEDCSADVTRAVGIKQLKEECVKMMADKR